MDKRKGTGIAVLLLCIVTFFVYAYLLMLSEWSPIVLQLSILIFAGGFLSVLAWIGYVMATTKPSSATISSED